jgi:hypothetical protein
VLVVYKYPLPIDDVVELLLPEGAEPLCVGLQRGVPMLWARVETDNYVGGRSRRFRVAGTGHPNAEGKYIGTLLVDDGALVFHVFDLGPLPERLVESTADDEYVQQLAEDIAADESSRMTDLRRSAGDGSDCP